MRGLGKTKSIRSHWSPHHFPSMNQPGTILRVHIWPPFSWPPTAKTSPTISTSTILLRWSGTGLNTTLSGFQGTVNNSQAYKHPQQISLETLSLSYYQPLETINIYQAPASHSPPLPSPGWKSIEILLVIICPYRGCNYGFRSTFEQSVHYRSPNSL